MIKIENVVLPSADQWHSIIMGTRNPKNSWDRSDSYEAVDCKKCGKIERGGICKKEDRDCTGFECYEIGPNDHKLMMSLAKGGPVHAKYRRMITVYLDITAPFYWWKEFDTYKIGTVANSCSTMHKIQDKEFTLDDFSCEHLMHADGELETYREDNIGKYECWAAFNPMYVLNCTAGTLNYYREKFLETNDKKYWWQMIQLLPTSYNQKRTIMLNYEVLHNMYISRKKHKLDEWHTFCDWIETLPYSEIITQC